MKETTKKIGDKTAPEWINDLNDAGLSAKERQRAVIAVEELIEDDSTHFDVGIQALGSAADDENEILCGYAVAAIGRLANRQPLTIEHLPNIDTLLADHATMPNAWLREQAIVAIGRLGLRSDRCISVLRNALEDSDPGIAAIAEAVLDNLGVPVDAPIPVSEPDRAPDSPETIIARMRSAEPAERAKAADYIGHLGRPAATEGVVGALKKLLSDVVGEVRVAAAGAVQSFGRAAVEHKGLLEQLARLLDNSYPGNDERVLQAGVKALTRIPWTLATGDDYSSVLSGLQSVAKDPTIEASVRKMANDALLPYRLQTQRRPGGLKAICHALVSFIVNIPTENQRGKAVAGSHRPEPSRRPKENGGETLAQGALEEVGIAWSRCRGNRVDNKEYFRFQTEHPAFRGTVWSVSLSDGSEGVFLFSAPPNANRPDSVGYLVLPGEPGTDITPVFIEQLDSPYALVDFGADNSEENIIKPQIKESLRLLDGWDNLALRDWRDWMDRFDDEGSIDDSITDDARNV